MKRKILFLIPAALLLAGCGGDEYGEPNEQQPGDQIRFEIGFAADSNSPQGRAATDADFKTTWVDGDEIGIFAVKSGTSLAASGNSIHNMKVTYSGGSWNGAYWPNDANKNENLDFYAYYPYAAAMTDPAAYIFSVKADQRAEADYNASDLLLAQAENVVKSGNTVSLQFSHALALVQVEVKREVNVPFFDDNDFTVTLTGAQPSAALDWGTPLTGTGSAAGIVMHKVAGMNYTYRALVPAQTLAADSKVTFVQTTTGKEITMEYPGISSAALTAGAAHKHSVTLGWGIDPNHAYAVGDVYPHAGPVMGVVYLIENDGKHGKVVGLQETSSVVWSSAYSTTNATDMANGRANMHTIYNLANDFSGFSAFAWVHAMNGGGTTNYYSDPSATNVWYLPASDELGGDNANSLYVAYANYGKPAFNGKLTAAGGTGFGDRYYWSSSEYDFNLAWYVYFYDGATNYGLKSSDIVRARCVLAF